MPSKDWIRLVYNSQGYFGSRRKRFVILICPMCGEEFARNLSKVAEHDNRFCSFGCEALFRQKFKKFK